MYKPLLEVDDLLWLMDSHKYVVTWVNVKLDAYSIKSTECDLICNTISIQGTDEKLAEGKWFYKKMKKANDFKKAIGSL